MLKSRKISLISFIACALTLGGVFGAWTFSEDGSTEAQAGVSTNVLPEDYWHFDNVQYTFSTSNGQEGADALTGTFPDSSTTKTLSVKGSSGMTYAIYEEFITEVGIPTCLDTTFTFSHWAYLKTEGDTTTLTHYNFDVGFETSVTLYAQYMPLSYPRLILEDEAAGTETTIATLFPNPDNDGEFMATNIIIEKNPGGRATNAIDYDANNRGSNNYAIVYNGNYYWCEYRVNEYTTIDYVYKGTYTVYFNPIENNSDEWATFGKHAYFQRQYNYTLAGNPSRSWTSSFWTFEFQNETITSETTKQATYKASNVIIYDDFYNGGVLDYQFKVVDFNFGQWVDNVSEDSLYIYKTGESSHYNFEMVDEYKKFGRYDITLTVNYNFYLIENTVKRIANFFPSSGSISLTPTNQTVKYYDTDGDLDYTDEVGYNGYTTAFTSDDLNHIGGEKGDTLQFVESWQDMYTKEVFTVEQLASLPINQNYNLQPIYGDPIEPNVVTFKHFSSVWSDLTTGYVYNCNPLYTTFYNLDIGALSPSSVSGYTFGGWQQQLTAEAEVVQNSYFSGLTAATITENKTYYARYTKTANSLVIPNNDTLVPADNKNQILFTDVTDASSTYSLGDAVYLLDSTGADLIVQNPANTAFGSTGKYAFTIDGSSGVNIINTSNLKIGSSYNTSTLYFKPNSNWLIDNAWFAVGFFIDWNGSATSYHKLIDDDGDGYYSCEIPEYTYSNFLRVHFFRMNPSYTSYNSAGIWNRTYEGQHFYVKQTSSSTINNKWELIDNSWTIYSSNISSGTLSSGGGISFPTISDSINTLYNVLYLVPGDLWTPAGAWFGAYYFNNSGNTWRPCIPIGDGKYVCVLPTGYTNVIFVRLNPASNTLSWGNMWNQTVDITNGVSRGKTYTITTGPDSNNKYSGSLS